MTTINTLITQNALMTTEQASNDESMNIELPTRDQLHIRNQETALKGESGDIIDFEPNIFSPSN